MNLQEKRPVVYTAYSKHYFFARMMISAFVLSKGYIPLNPFTNWEYFMNDMVERDLVIRGNNNLITLSDEVWTFGPIADGVFAEVKLAQSLHKIVKHFSVGKEQRDITPISINKLIFENELLEKINEQEINKVFKKEEKLYPNGECL